MSPDGPAGPAHRDGDAPRYQLALSYADANADYVREVADSLIQQGVTLFDRSSDGLIGRYLPAEIQRIYRDEVGHAVLFISAAYVDDLSVVERRAALDRAIADDAFALPVRFDDTEVPGLSSNVGSVRLVDDAGADVAPDQLAGMIVAWLRNRDGVIRQRSRLSGWSTFDPAKLHCVTVESETDAGSGIGRLSSVVNLILNGKEGRAVWRSARECLQGTETLNGHRELPDDYQPKTVARTTIPVADAVRSAADLEHAVRLIIEADVALFEVSRFEPAVMLLLGIRAATRRGVTVVSHGNGWYEGTPLDRPFNLADLSLASHTPAPAVGDDLRESRLARRIRNGFDQLRRHPQYHDLPVYDALRGLGADLAARSPVALDDEVLVLCTYDEDHYPVWSVLRAEISNALFDHDLSGMTIVRLQDLPTPQIVSQALYERIRRCVGCVVDWTRASPSTFFELGVRLVASPWGTVHIASRSWLDRVETGHPAARERLPPPLQIQRMLELFAPIVYPEPPGVGLGQTVAQQLVDVERSGPRSGHRIRATAVRAVEEVEPRIPDVAAHLQDVADRLDSPVSRQLIPQALFFESQEIKLDHERAARERRVAAWLYLEHRVDAGSLDEDDPRRQLWQALGSQVSGSLLDSGDEADFSLGIEISEQVSSE